MRQAVKMAANAGVFLVQQRRDADDFGDFPADEFGDEGFSPDAFAFSAEFQIAPDEVADDGGVGLVKIRRVVAGIRAPATRTPSCAAELEKSGGAQIVRVLVPDDDVFAAARRRRAVRESPRATTAGRVPLSMPAAENTLMPTTSCVETRLRQAAATVAWPVKLVRPRSTMPAPTVRRAENQKMAFGFSTMTTRATALVEWLKSRPGGPGRARAGQTDGGRRPPADSDRLTRIVFARFLTLSSAGCYHQRRCWPQK